MVFNFKALLAPRVVRFVIISAVRLIGIIAIAMVIGAEIQEIVHNIQGYAKAVKHKGSNDVGNVLPPSQNLTTRAIFSFAAAFTANDTDLEAAQNLSCGYVEGTSVPDHAAGILFSTVFRFLSILVLLLLLLSEVSPPWPPIANFFLKHCPPLSEDASTGFLGATMLWISTSILSTNAQTFATVAAWFLFVLGIMNLLLSLVMGSAIRRHRSIVDTDKSKRPNELPTSFSSARVSKKGKVSYPAPVDVGEIGFPTPAYGMYNHSRTSMAASEFGMSAYSHAPSSTGPLTRPSEMVERRAGSPIGVSRSRSGKGILKIRTPEEEEEDEEQQRVHHHTPPSYAH